MSAIKYCITVVLEGYWLNIRELFANQTETWCKHDYKKSSEAKNTHKFQQGICNSTSWEFLLRYITWSNRQCTCTTGSSAFLQSSLFQPNKVSINAPWTLNHLHNIKRSWLCMGLPTRGGGVCYFLTLNLAFKAISQNRGKDGEGGKRGKTKPLRKFKIFIDIIL